MWRRRNNQQAKRISGIRILMVGALMWMIGAQVRNFCEGFYIRKLGFQGAMHCRCICVLVGPSRSGRMMEGDAASFSMRRVHTNSWARISATGVFGLWRCENNTRSSNGGFHLNRGVQVGKVWLSPWWWSEWIQALRSDSTGGALEEWGDVLQLRLVWTITHDWKCNETEWNRMTVRCFCLICEGRNAKKMGNAFLADRDV